MTVRQFNTLVHSPIEVRSGYNGKTLCRTYDAKKHKSVSERDITSVWTEIRTTNGCGYSSIAKPVICVYVHGDVECAAEAALKKGAEG